MQPINIYNSPDVKVTIDENGTPVDVYVSGGSSLSIAFYSTYSALPSPGQEGILYITEDTNFIYRWDGALNAYIQVGGGAASLQDVTDVGNTTTNDIQLINDADVILGAGGKVLMDNGSKLQEGTTDAGNGGSKGIALKCSVDYELKWEAGRLYTMEQDGFTIREVSHNFTFAPSVTDDDSKGFVVGSRWILDNGDIYTCTDATTGTAVWSLEPAKVPYTGATGNVNLGEYGVSGGYYQFDTTPTEYTQAVGNVGWNDTEGTIETLLKGGSVILEIGQKLVARVVNGTGGNVLRSNYQVVKVTGAQGQRLQVNLAQGNNDANSADTLGLIAENISNNQSGFIVTSGIISEINTTGSLQSETWADGDPLYLSPTIAGKITNVKPQAPNHTVIVGFVVYAHSVHGKIFVKIDNGYELDELHNVKINTPLNGQVLRYNGTTFVWENSNDSDNLTFNAPLSRSVNDISISQASSSADGYLSSSDWSTFNNKQNALTNPVTGTGTNNEIAYFNTTGSTIGSLSTATYPSLTELSYVKGVTSAIQTQLNGKQDTLTLTTTGTSGAATLVGSTLNIPQYAAGITGSGTSGQVAYWNGTSSQTGSNNLFWDATNNRLGIGGSPGSYSLDVNGTARVSGNSVISTWIGIGGVTSQSATGERLNVQGACLISGSAPASNFLLYAISSNNKFILGSEASVGGSNNNYINYVYGNNSFITYTNNVARLTVTGGGNILIGTTTDSGYKLDVNGTARVQDNLLVSKNQNAQTSITITNTTSGTASQVGTVFTSDSGSGVSSFGKYSTTTTAYKIISSKDFYIYNGTTAGDITIYNEFSSGKIKFASGGSSTSHLEVASNGTLNSSASATASSAIARGVNLTPTLIAAANNDVLVGLDINPTFTNGAFTGISNIGIRILGAFLGQNQRSFIITPADSLGFMNITADISTTINYTCGYNGHNFKYNDGTNSSTPLVIKHNQISGVPFQDNQVTLGVSNTRWSNVWSVKTFADSYGFGNTSNIGLSYTANPTNGIRFDFTNNLLTFYNNSTSSARFFSNGNLLIQTGGTITDSGYKLDVNGTLRSQGDFTLSDAKNLILGTTTGTKIGTATSQKIGFWNATPIVQPTTAVTASTLVSNLGTPLTDTDTFDGYTLKQIVKALRNTGILA